MRINHNLSALNTYSRLAKADFDKSNSLEKLSSGLRINRAGDDAAGLAISEKMRTQIRGLDQASRNTQDGISMIQTAEGALNETQSIIQRMRELTVQSANDTNTGEDRSEIQNEISQLSTEVNRIAGTTEFNKQKLLDGQFSESKVDGAKVSVEKSAKNVTQAMFEIEISCIPNDSAHDLCITCNDGSGVISISIAKLCGDTLGSRVSNLVSKLNSCNALVCQWDIQAKGNKISFTSKRDLHDVTNNISINACTKILSDATTHLMSICQAIQKQEASCATAQREYLTLSEDIMKEGVLVKIGDRNAVLWDSSQNNYSNSSDMLNKLNLDACTLTIDLHNANSDTLTEVMQCICASMGSTCVDIAYDSTNSRICVVSLCVGESQSKYANVAVSGVAGTVVASGNGTALQIGANTDQTFTVYFGDMTGKGIGLTSDTAGKEITTCSGAKAYFTSDMSVEKDGKATEYALDVTTAEKATAAISVYDDALRAVSSQRSKLGAYQNRLEHTITNLNTASENLTAAESRIRDVDMAKEMMEFTKNNILSQAATSMLAQANQQPQGVLQLLKG